MRLFNRARRQRPAGRAGRLPPPSMEFLEDRTLPSLVAAFDFGEASGATVSDASGNGNTGTISGASRTAAGMYGAALSFNRTSSWVTVPDASSLHLTAAMTLEAWVQPTAPTAA